MKQLRKTKSNRKKSTSTKTKTKTKTRRNKKMMIGGNPKISLGITYDTIYEYLLELLPDFKKNVLEKNKKFIQSISINNDNFSVCFDFSENKDFRIFINDSLQWLLFDYNPYIFDTLLKVIFSCFHVPKPRDKTLPYDPNNPEFLKEDADSFQILFVNLQNKILEKMNENFNAIDEDKKNEIQLLTLILYVLTIPSISLAVSNLINDNKDVFRKKLTDIKCVLTEITYEKINKDSVRSKITNYFETFNPQIRYTEIPNLLGNIAKCLPHLLNSFATAYLRAKGNALSQTLSENIVTPVREKAQTFVSQATSYIPSVFRRMPIPQ